MSESISTASKKCLTSIPQRSNLRSWRPDRMSTRFVLSTISRWRSMLLKETDWSTLIITQNWEESKCQSSELGVNVWHQVRGKVFLLGDVMHSYLNKSMFKWKEYKVSFLYIYSKFYFIITAVRIILKRDYKSSTKMYGRTYIEKNKDLDLYRKL